MNKINVMIYPLTPENCYIYDHKELLNKFNITYAVADDFLETKKYCSASFDDCVRMNEVDALLVLPIKSENISKVIFRIEEALEAGKNTFSMISFSDSIIDKFNCICLRTHTSFQILNIENIENAEIQSRELWEIETPIVTIAEISENCGLVDLQLAIRKYFQNRNYRISQIGSFEYCNLFGLHSFPKYMNRNSIVSVIDQTLLFNHFIKELEIRERPDLIIISLPDSLLPYNNKFHFGFGNTSFIACNAFTSDYTIISLPLQQYQSNFIDEAENLLECRFNLRPDTWIMSNVFANYSEVENEEYIRYYFFGSDEVSKMIAASDSRIINGVNPNTIERLCNNIINMLSENTIY